MSAAASKRWRQRNPEKVREHKRLSYHRNKEEIRARMRPRNLANARALRQSVINLFGAKCCRCGFDDPRALQVDHINGGGSRERKEDNNRGKFYKRLLSDTSGYQLLCANCNWIKKHEENEHKWNTEKRIKNTSTIDED